MFTSAVHVYFPSPAEVATLGKPANSAMATSPVQESGGAHLADRGWIDVQKKTFTNWVNEKLKDTPCKVEVLEKDFDDGITLVKLLEVLSKKKMHKK